MQKSDSSTVSQVAALRQARPLGKPAAPLPSVRRTAIAVCLDLDKDSKAKTAVSANTSPKVVAQTVADLSCNVAASAGSSLSSSLASSPSFSSSSAASSPSLSFAPPFFSLSSPSDALHEQPPLSVGHGLLVEIPKSEENSTATAANTPVSGGSQTTPRSSRDGSNPGSARRDSKSGRPPLHPSTVKVSPLLGSGTSSPALPLMPRFSLSASAAEVRTPNTNWTKIDDVYVNMTAAERGLVVIQVQNPEDDPSFVTDVKKDGEDTIEVKTSSERTLVVTSSGEFNLSFQYERMQALAEKIFNLSPDLKFTDSNKVHGMFRVRSLFSLIKAYSGSGDVILQNKGRREEFCIPVLGVYMYLWSNQKNLKALGNVSRVVTATCMIGSSFEGFYSDNTRGPLIIHNMKILPEKKIRKVSYNKDAANAYNAAVFENLKLQTALFKKLSSATGSSPSKQSHLPDYDYIFFLIGVYLQDGIDFTELCKAILIVFKQSEIYRAKDTDISGQGGIPVAIESPLDNVFGKMRECKQLAQVEDELKKIGIIAGKKLSIGEFLKSCIDKLIASSSPNQQHKHAWEIILERYKWKISLDLYNENNKQKKLDLKDVVNSSEHNLPDELRALVSKFSLRENLKTPDDLLALANLVIPVCAALLADNQIVVFILPFSEKQMQVQFSRYFKGTFDNVVFITTPEPVICSYPLNTNSSLFYAPVSPCHHRLSWLIKKDDILSQVQANVGKVGRAPSITLTLT